MVARRMMPVSPLPPTVAQNSSASGPLGVSRRISPSAVSRSIDRTWLPKLPALWWFLPWMSHAMAPPMVTCRVPGSTGTHSPSGSAARISWSRLTPASTSTKWLSPYERPIPRAITPRASACDTALAITSGSGVDSTCATLGAVRAQPVSRRVLVSNIVTRVPPDASGSAQPEYDRPLDDEVDHSRGALRDDERHRHGPHPVVEQMQAEVVESDLYGEGDRVQSHDPDEPGGAGVCLERPSPVDQVGRDGADDEADRLGQVDLQAHSLIQEHVEAKVDDRRETAGDDESPHLGLQRQVRRHGRLGHPGSLASQAAGPQHTAQRLDRAAERMLGGGGEPDNDAVVVGDLLTGQWMAHPRQALQRDTGLTSPSQHLVLTALGQGQQHVDAGGQTTDPNVESGQRVDENVAAPAVTRTHPANVAVVLTAGDEVGHRELVDGVDVELLATGGVDDRADEVVGQRHPPQPQGLRQALAGRSQVGDPLGTQGLQRPYGLAVVAELAVVVVVEHVATGALGPVDDGGAPRRVQRHALRVVVGW